MTDPLNGHWLKAVAQIGVPAALALYLVWYTTVGVTAQIEQHDRRTALSLALLQRICVHTARTPQDVRECLTPLSEGR